jgi:hypothetical protein
MVATGVVVVGIEYYGESGIGCEYFWDFVVLVDAVALVLKVKILIDVERAIFDDMYPNIIGVALGAELKCVVAYEFVIDLYLYALLIRCAHVNILNMVD